MLANGDYELAEALAEQRDLTYYATHTLPAKQKAGTHDSYYKSELDRSNMRKSMQLGKFECLGSCGSVYKVKMALQGHVRKCLEKNKVGLKGQNGCWQPGAPPIVG